MYPPIHTLCKRYLIFCFLFPKLCLVFIKIQWKPTQIHICLIYLTHILICSCYTMVSVSVPFCFYLILFMPCSAYGQKYPFREPFKCLKYLLLYSLHFIKCQKITWLLKIFTRLLLQCILIYCMSPGKILINRIMRSLKIQWSSNSLTCCCQPNISNYKH